MCSYIVPVQGQLGCHIYCGHPCPVTTAIGHTGTLTAFRLTGLTRLSTMGQGLSRLLCEISDQHPRDQQTVRRTTAETRGLLKQWELHLSHREPAQTN